MRCPNLRPPASLAYASPPSSAMRRIAQRGVSLAPRNASHAERAARSLCEAVPKVTDAHSAPFWHFGTLLVREFQEITRSLSSYTLRERLVLCPPLNALRGILG